ncbi:MAG: polysaccharide pyruvyl transferase family protein [Alphaproteobacteria bacterium]|uniref:polysaccharide pyruvyl transferase family protein n=1 Tax=Maricaulis alexandrii TaxID=2570354 RepID=UPI001109764C|nr:polysaccharide pyruvyl transferase family protein [Maricaulis alexandrii]MCR9267631.1 polysaccharide pyruvyl transferase family protein [Alphaproteobacteria bacterium]
MPRKSRMALLGYYGRHNFGDDLMINALCRRLCSPEREVRVFTGDPYLTDILPADVSVRPRSPWQLLTALVWCDTFIMAGGTIFHDSYKAEIRRNYVKHLWAYALLLGLARLLGKTVRMIGVGIGPLSTRAARAPSRLALRTAASLHVRDTSSAEEVQRLLPRSTAPVLVGQDLAFLARDHLNRVGQAVQPENRLGLSILDMSQFLDDASANQFWTGLAEAISDAMDTDPSLQLTLFCYWTAPGRPNDFDPAQAFLDMLAPDCRDRVHLAAYDGDIEPIIEETARCRGIVATRFHAAVVSWLVGRPTAVVCYNRKVRDFADQVNLPEAWRFAGDQPLDADAVRHALKGLLSPAPAALDTGTDGTMTDRLDDALGVA